MIEDDKHLNAFVRLPEGRLIILGEAGTILASQDAGKTWSAVASPYKGSLFGGVVADDGAVVAFGLRGRIFRSTDAGTTWKAVDNPSVATLLGGSKLPDGALVIAGNGGTVLVSRDNGQSFVPLATGSTKAFAKAVLGPANAVILVGETGRARGGAAARKAIGARRRCSTALIQAVSNFVFGNRKVAAGRLRRRSPSLFAASASRLTVDAGFNKMVPLKHPYMQVYRDYEKVFGGANRVAVAIVQKDGDIFNKEYMAKLKALTDDVFLLNGVDRPVGEVALHAQHALHRGDRGGLRGRQRHPRHLPGHRRRPEAGARQRAEVERDRPHGGDGLHRRAGGGGAPRDRPADRASA